MTAQRLFRCLIGLVVFTNVFLVTFYDAQPIIGESIVQEATVGMDGEIVSKETIAHPIESEVPVHQDNAVVEEGIGDPNCPSRSHIIKCAGKYLDTDQDGYLSRKELDTAINRLPWYGRGILQLLGSTDKMMHKCDVDKDGYISMDYDMVHNEDKCLKTCFKRRAFKSSFFPDCKL
jgi:EF hand